MIIYLKRKKLAKNLVVSQKVCTFAPAFDKRVGAKLLRIGI